MSSAPEPGFFRKPAPVLEPCGSECSQIREVPDHQEVYLDSDGYSSIVIEILEYQEKGSDEEALQYHFGDLIDEEDSTNILEQGRAVMAKLR